jgi:hypothetical protein
MHEFWKLISERLTCSCVCVRPDTVFMETLLRILVLQPGGNTLRDMKLCVAPVSNVTNWQCY